MKRVSYWRAECLVDSDCYSVRAKTKKDVHAKLTVEMGMELDTLDDGWGEKVKAYYLNGTAQYALPEKVFIDYVDQMDLICQLTGEGRGSY